jgi:ribosomal protein S18 acetylase RimI-like enzyme
MAALANQSVPFAAATLRPIRESDSDLLFAIYASTRTEELAQVDWDETQKQGFLRMQFEAQRRSYASGYSGAEFQVILVGGQPAGRLYVDRRDREIRVMDITLLPSFRGRGVGTALLNEILAEAERTARRVSIHVESFNPAQRLYGRLGFVKIASHGVYHLLEWKPSSAPAEGAQSTSREKA